MSDFSTKDLETINPQGMTLLRQIADAVSKNHLIKVFKKKIISLKLFLNLFYINSHFLFVF